jgi:hypothetical protein
MPLFCRSPWCKVKITTSISFLFLLLTSQFGHSLLFAVQQWEIRKDWEARLLSQIPETSLDRIEESADLHWEDAGKEFEYRGNMYDVVKTRIISGKVIHFAVNDRQEEQLIRNFSRIMKESQDGTDAPRNNKIPLKYQSFVFTLPDLVPVPGSRTSTGISFSRQKMCTLTQPHLVIPRPPRS